MPRQKTVPRQERLLKLLEPDGFRFLWADGFHREFAIFRPSPSHPGLSERIKVTCAGEQGEWAMAFAEIAAIPFAECDGLLISERISRPSENGMHYVELAGQAEAKVWEREISLSAKDACSDLALGSGKALLDSNAPARVAAESYFQRLRAEFTEPVFAYLDFQLRQAMKPEDVDRAEQMSDEAHFLPWQYSRDESSIRSVVALAILRYIDEMEPHLRPQFASRIRESLEAHRRVQFLADRLYWERANRRAETV